MFAKWAGAGVAAAAALILLASLHTSADQVTPNTWSGSWQTAWTGGGATSAAMDLTQTGDTVTGTYQHLSGTIQGTVTNATLSGTWKQNNSSGPFAFTFAPDGQSWDGTWSDNAGGGSWHGTCTAGACLQNGRVVASPSASATRPSATVVECNRDTTVTTNAHFSCNALVSDAQLPVQLPAPSGTVTWTSSVGSFSPASCTLQPASSGVPSCNVDYDATNQDFPNQTGVPNVTASYSGDRVYSASQGSAKSIVAADSGGGVSPWLIGLGAAGVAAAAAVGIAIAIGKGAASGAAAAGSAMDADNPDYVPRPDELPSSPNYKPPASPAPMGTPDNPDYVPRPDELPSSSNYKPPASPAPMGTPDNPDFVPRPDQLPSSPNYKPYEPTKPH